MTLEKFSSNLYRVRCGRCLFGQIKRDGRAWTAEIRETESGALYRFAGIWKTRQAAVEEIEYLLSRESDGR